MSVSGGKDRHRPGYWKERQEKLKESGAVQKDRHRPGYYREYNLKHPERLERIGIVLKTEDGSEIVGRDMMNRPVTRNRFTDVLRNKELEFHDDDMD